MGNSTKREIIATIILLLFTTINAQNPITLWEKDFHANGYESFSAVIQTADSNFVCVGKITSFDELEYTDWWIVKLNGQGDTIWTSTKKTFGVSERFTDIIELKEFNNDLLIVGEADNKAYVVRMDKDGEIKWEKTYDNGYFSSSFSSVVQTYNNRFILCGAVFYYKNEKLTYDILLNSINVRGDIEWTKIYDLGNDNTEGATSIIELADSGFAIVGQEFFKFDSPWSEVFILKLDKNGDILWHKLYGTDGYDSAGEIKELQNGDLIISATYLPLNNDGDFWLLKTDKYGDTLWTKKYGGESSESSSSIDLTMDNGFIVTGSTESFTNGFIDMWVLRTDSLGNTLWTQNYGGRYGDDGNSVITTFTGDYVIAGLHISEEFVENDSNYKQTHNGYAIRIADNFVNIIDEDIPTCVSEYKLSQNYPNPFNPLTIINYAIPKDGFVNLTVYNILGQQVAVFVNKYQATGRYSVEFNAKDLPSGIYIYKLQAGEFSSTKKMVLAK